MLSTSTRTGRVMFSWIFALGACGVAMINTTSATTTTITTTLQTSRPTNDLDQGVFYGYQAWHGGPDHNFSHWFNTNVTDAKNIHGDFWPDFTDYIQAGVPLYDTNMKYPDGSTVQVYSANDYKTIDLHIKWMKEYGIKGLFLQRQQLNIHKPGMLHWMDTKTRHVRAACEKHKVKFAMMPCNNDKSKNGNPKMVDQIINDWKHLVDDLNITNSSQYAFQDGKPVIGFWGLGFENRPMTPEQATEILDFFQNSTDPKYQVYVMGGVPYDWRTDPNKAGWRPVFERLDMVSPWRTIFRDPYNQTVIDTMLGDLENCTSNGIDYNPVVSPGASTWNINKGNSTCYNGKKGNSTCYNWKPRCGGKFFWQQVYEVVKMRSKFMYVAMFDEIDEGTAMYKQAVSVDDLPVDTQLVPLDVDGYALPSDWYLQLGREAQKMLDGRINLTNKIPISMPSRSDVNDSLCVSYLVSE